MCYCSRANRDALDTKQIDAYIATGRDPHNRGWRAYFAEAGQAPDAGASPKEKMAYNLRRSHVLQRI